MFRSFRYRVARWIAPPAGRVSRRMYHMAKASRLTEGWGQSDTSADSEMASSLRTMRARSRALIRDAAYAKRARVIVVNNIIGAGIGLQAQVMSASGKLDERINTEIEDAWKEWSRADSCHTGGSLHMSDLERMVMGQIFETGEIFIRKHLRTFGKSRIPFALEVIEPERIADEFQPSALGQSAGVRLGIECDEFYRPMAYWIRRLHPGELRLTANRTDRVERVPADQMIHLRIIDRWPQTRGEPWLHAAARKLNDMDGYSEAEIIAARGAASYMATIETDGDYGEQTEDEGREIGLEPGTVERLKPGEKFNFVSPNRPNKEIDPFMRLMLREAAAGSGVCYESLSRDYSQSNYSSSRLALLDDRDLWRIFQLWFIRGFREALHAEWLQQAVLARAIQNIRVEEYAANPQRFELVRFKPRGWSWIDPAKEVQAYKEAIRSGFTTVADVIALTGAGRDLEDVLTERARELELMREKGLSFDTDPQADPATGRDDAGGQDEPQRVVSFPG